LFTMSCFIDSTTEGEIGEDNLNVESETPVEDFQTSGVGPYEEDEEDLETEPLVISTQPPATRAPPLLPEVASGRVPPVGGIPPQGQNPPYQINPQWDFAQAAEIQRLRANCSTSVQGIRNGRWQLRCTQPLKKHIMRGKKGRRRKKKKGVKVNFKSPFKPNYIPKSKKKERKKKQHDKRSKRKNNLRKPKNKGVSIKFKSKFKPNYIPKSKKKKNGKKV